MVIFYSYVSLPEGKFWGEEFWVLKGLGHGSVCNLLLLSAQIAEFVAGAGSLGEV
jgi:hypothetical protein